MMKRLLLIMNPYSGTRKGAKNLSSIIEVFNRANYQVTAYMTAAAGDGEEAAAKWAADYDLIVCAGGDGTFNEVASGVIRSGAEVPIGYIPCGSTNDFANSLGLPKDVLDAAKAIVTGTPTPFDMGRFGQRYFSYVASFGAFTKTSYATSQNVKNMLGHLAYILGGIKEISSLHSYEVGFAVDGGEISYGKYIFGAVSNSTSVGGILTLDPALVDMNDGEFELLLVKYPTTLWELNECIVALTKQNYNSPMLKFCSARSIKIQADESMDWTLDGEWEPGKKEVAVENCHSAIRVITGGAAAK